MKIKLIMRTFVFLIISFQGFSQSAAERIDISGNWKFQKGDSPEDSKSTFDDSNWKSVQVGKNWTSQGYPDYEGSAFYRRNVVIPSSFNKTSIYFGNRLKLSLGKIYSTGVIWFNGEEIGHNTDGKYSIPLELVKWDKSNLIAVNVHGAGGGGGLFEGDYEIVPFEKLSDLILIQSDNTLADFTQANLKLSQTINFKFLSSFNQLQAQFKVKIFNTQTGEVVHEKTNDIVIGTKSDSSFTYSVHIKNPGFYKANYSLYSKFLKDTISTNVLLTYKLGDHSNPHTVNPIINNKIPGKVGSFDLNKIQLTGYLGNRVNANITERLLQIDEKGILEGFYNRPGTQTWVGEYPGKYLHAASRAWRNSGNIQLITQMNRIVDVLLASQDKDGYLGTYAPENYWTGWDVWAHKYDLLGLLSYYSVTGYKPALEASVKVGNLMCKTFGNAPGQLNIEEHGEHVGMASCSILEPMTELYRFTGDQKYMDFCAYIIEAYDHPNGPKIITTLNTIGKVNQTANAKAYEMMSNFTVIIKLYQLTGDAKLLSAVETAWNDIVANRLYITGTCSKGEHFQGDGVLPAENDDHMGEGCVTTTWLQYNQALYNLTGEAKYIDEMEKAIYNHLLAAENPVTGCVAYYTALQGKKPYRCTINGHCCLASVPRGIAAIPELVYTKSATNGCLINIYASGSFNDSLKTTDGKIVPVKVSISSDFPRSGKATISVSTSKPSNFLINLRVPAWCKNFTAKLKSIIGFSHTHKSGGGCGDFKDILLQPTSGKLQLNPGTDVDPDVGYLDSCVLVKVEISPVSIANAWLNLKSEIPDWNFEKVVEQNKSEWRQKLDKFSIEGGSDKEQTLFVTGIYNVLMYPMLYMDVNGEYRGPDHKVYRARGYNNYSGYIGTWDVFRAANPLLTLIENKLKINELRLFGADS